MHKKKKKEPFRQSQQHENTNGHDHTEFGLINHRRRQRLIREKRRFSNSPGRHSSIQNGRAKISSEMKLKLKRYLLSPPFFLPSSSFATLTDNKTLSKLRWCKKKTTQSDNNNQTNDQKYLHTS